ncbi:hypothetical protein DPMN_032393 [Dreissena polymorpha]|uniref:Uncharacterized protein n=1 Tax=Dreissena polymorpha TaxID=45954 RepID=A0A9D4M6H2_DREPO|nr:hypothetical protein DPMN_032393 [Dreissena polymorpha]
MVPIVSPVPGAPIVSIWTGSPFVCMLAVVPPVPDLPWVRALHRVFSVVFISERLTQLSNKGINARTSK